MAMDRPKGGLFEKAFRVARNVVPFLALTACDQKVCEGPLSSLSVDRCNAVVVSKIEDCMGGFFTSGNGSGTVDGCLHEVREDLQEQADDLEQDCIDAGKTGDEAVQCRDAIMTCLYGTPGKSPRVKDCVNQVILPSVDGTSR